MLKGRLCDAFPCLLWTAGGGAWGQQQVESDRKGVKYFLEAGAGVALIPRLVPSRRGHHMPPLKKRQMWQLVSNLPARGQKHLAQLKCVLEAELERNVPWAILGFGNCGFLLPGLQPGSPALWWALNWEGGEDKNWCEFRARAKDELIRSGPLTNAELISTSVRTHLWHAPSSAQCISWRVLLLPYCEVWCEGEQLLLSLFLMWIFILMGVIAYTVFCIQLMMSALGGEREGWW